MKERGRETAHGAEGESGKYQKLLIASPETGETETGDTRGPGAGPTLPVEAETTKKDRLTIESRRLATRTE